MREKRYLNRQWEFTEHFTEEFIRQPKEGCYESVSIPHTCKETPLHYFDESLYQLVCGYRKMIYAQKGWRGKHVFLTFEGVGHECTVFLNGQCIAKHHCGYTAFTVDLAEYLKWGEDNLLAVCVDSRECNNIPPFGFVIDYMTFGGIYRDVYLEITEKAYLADVFLQPVVTNVQMKTGCLRSQISLAGTDPAYTIRQFMKKEGEEQAHLIGSQSADGEMIEVEFSVGEIKLWSPETPELYEVETQLFYGDELIDRHCAYIGFRKASFCKDGFYLNGKKYKIRGLNRHQSYPYAGYAMPASMQRLDAKILKEELGVNAVRTSHYPQSHDFMDACDRLGLLVFTEMPGWQHIGDEEWKKQAIANTEEMVLQYRNHTSIILWGVRINESIDDDDFYQRTNAAARKLDPTRPTGGVRASKKSSLLEDVYTYNDFIHDGKHPGCLKKKQVTSDMEKPYLISEYNGHMFPTKSFDCEDHRTEHALRHARVLDQVNGEKDISGSFGWCMTDYNTHKDFGSGDRICYHGVMDIFRNPKPAAYVYQSQQEQIPVLELSASMDIGEHPGCSRGNTYLFTNADAVRVYKNDQMIREYKKEETEFKNLAHGPIALNDYIGDLLSKKENINGLQERFLKDILNKTAIVGMNNLDLKTYCKAAWLILRYKMNMDDAIDLYTRYVGDWGGTSTTYQFEAISQGKVVKTIVKKPMKQIELEAEADHTVLQEDHTYDVAAVRIRAKDEMGNLLSWYQEPVTLKVEGPAELIGPDLISLHGGMGGTYVKTLGVAGEVRLIIKTAQAKEQELVFQIRV